MRLTKEQKDTIYPSIIKEFLEDEVITLQGLAKKYNVSYGSLYKYAKEHNVNMRKKRRPLRHNERIINEVIERYQNDKTTSAKSLAEEYGVCYPTITRWLKLANVNFRYPTTTEHLEKLDEATELYLSTDLTVKEAAKQIGIGKNSFRKHLKAESKLKRNVNCQKDISFNKRYFSKIDTEEKAYWFGFIYADGCVRYNLDDNSGSLSIELAKKDINMLQLFNNCIESNVAIKERQRIQESGYISDFCSVTLCSRDLVKDLMKYGCIPNKTYEGKIPKSLFASNKKLMVAFLRGYLDGDGYISKNERSLHIVSYTVYNCKVMNFLLNAIIKVSGVVPTVTYETNQYSGEYRIRIMNKKDFFRFLEVLYENSTIHMERKYNRYLMHLTSRLETNLTEVSGL